MEVPPSDRASACRILALLLVTLAAVPRGAVAGETRRFRVLRYGEAAGELVMERDAASLALRQVLTDGPTVEELRVSGATSGRPRQVTLRRADEAVEAILDHGVLQISTRAGARPLLVGNDAFALVADAHYAGLFVLADLVPRLEGATRGFELVPADTLAAQRVDFFYEGVHGVEIEGQEFRLHCFAARWPGGTARVDLDADGEWTRLQVGAVWTWQRCDAAPRGVVAAEAPARGGRELRFPGPTGSSMPATLRAGSGVPPGAGVVLVNGSTPRDRDGNGPDDTPPFGDLYRVLAEGLEEAGIASLCYDSARRGGAPPRLEDSIAEAVAAARGLAESGAIDPDRLVLLGHSEAALVVLLAAQRLQPAPAALVLLACPGAGLPSVAVEQAGTILAVQGYPPAAIQVRQQQRREFFAWLQDPASRADPPPADGLLAIGAPDWWRDHARIDWAAELARGTPPVLSLHGERDVNVPLHHQAELVGRLEAAGTAVEAQAFPRLDHYFLPSGNGDPLRLQEKGRCVDPGVVRTLVAWLRRTLDAGSALTEEDDG